MWGLDLLRSQLKTVAHTSGGHACLRTLANSLQGRCQDYILERLLEPITPDDNQAITLVIPGDKFKKTQGALDICLGWKPTLLYPKRDDPVAEAQMVVLREEWKAIVERVRQMPNYGAMSNH